MPLSNDAPHSHLVCRYWYQGYKSPYYKETHAAFRAKVRAFVDKEIMPFVHEWDEAGTYPPELHEKAYKAGMCVLISRSYVF